VFLVQKRWQQKKNYNQNTKACFITKMSSPYASLANFKMESPPSSKVDTTNWKLSDFEVLETLGTFKQKLINF